MHTCTNKEVFSLLMVAAFSVYPATGSAQTKKERKAEISADVFVGTTSFVSGIDLKPYQPLPDLQYNYKLAWGAGFDLGYRLLSRVFVHGSIDYLQRGATTSEAMSGAQLYRLSYIDLWLYSEYVTSRPVQFTFMGGFTESTLLAAVKTQSSGNTVGVNNFTGIDIGMVAGPGVLFPVKEKKIRFRALFSYGFRDVFAESYFNNQVIAHNHSWFIQIGYVW